MTGPAWIFSRCSPPLARFPPRRSRRVLPTAGCRGESTKPVPKLPPPQRVARKSTFIHPLACDLGEKEGELEWSLERSCHEITSAPKHDTPHDSLSCACGCPLASGPVEKRREAEWSLQRLNHENPSAPKGAPPNGAGSAWSCALVTGLEEQRGETEWH